MESNFKIQLQYGGAKIPIGERNKEQELQASLEKLARAKEKAFSRGLPIIWGENGKVVAEYANGKKFLVVDRKITDELYVK